MTGKYEIKVNTYFLKKKKLNNLEWKKTSKTKTKIVLNGEN